MLDPSPIAVSVACAIPQCLIFADCDEASLFDPGDAGAINGGDETDLQKTGDIGICIRQSLGTNIKFQKIARANPLKLFVSVD